MENKELEEWVREVAHDWFGTPPLRAPTTETLMRVVRKLKQDNEEMRHHIALCSGSCQTPEQFKLSREQWELKNKDIETCPGCGGMVSFVEEDRTEGKVLRARCVDPKVTGCA